MNIIRNEKGSFAIHRASWGWGVLNLATGYVERCQSEQEALDWIKDGCIPSKGKDESELMDQYLDYLDETLGINQRIEMWAILNFAPHQVARVCADLRDVAAGNREGNQFEREALDDIFPELKGQGGP